MLGGKPEGHRELYKEGDYGAFESTVERVLGERLRSSKDDADEFWGALANVDWIGPNGEAIGYSFRAAGDFIAAIRKDEGEMTYMNYYMNSQYGVVPSWIAEALGFEGWNYEVLL